MGLIRGALFTVLSIILFVSLLGMNTFGTISNSLEYDTLQPQLVPLVTETVVNQTDIVEQVELFLPLMEIYCLNNTEFAYTVQNTTLNIPCDNINNGSEAIINYVVLSMVEDTYYKEYDCEFLECDLSPPYHMISQKAQDYWNEWFYVALVLSIVLVVASVIIMENRSGYPFILGGLLIISSLLFAKMEWIFSFLGDGEFVAFLGLFFSKAYTVFLINFLIGIVLILIGLALKFLGWGEYLNNLLSVKKKDS